MAKRLRLEEEQRKQQEIKEGKRMPNGHELACKCVPCQLMRLNFNTMVHRNSILDLNNRLTALEQKAVLKEVPKVEQQPVHDPTQPCDHAVHGQEPPVQQAVREEGDPAGAPPA
jgi:hypothetical protein